MVYLMDKCDFFYNIVSTNPEGSIAVDAVSKHEYNVTLQLKTRHSEDAMYPPIVMNEVDIELVRQRALANHNGTVLAWIRQSKDLVEMDVAQKRREKNKLENRISKSKL